MGHSVLQAELVIFYFQTKASLVVIIRVSISSDGKDREFLSRLALTFTMMENLPPETRGKLD